MSPRLTTLAGLDVRLQLRYGIYYAYAFVIAFYVAVAVAFGNRLPAGAVGFIVYSDPAVLGFFFIGALMMLEKAEGTRIALAVTPATPADYLWAKTLTLTTVAVVAVAIIGALAHAHPNWAVLLPATVMTSVCYIGIGVPIALRFRTVTSYLIGSAGWLTPVVAPGLIAFLDPMPAWAMIVPTAAQLRLILVGVGAAETGKAELAAMFAVALAAAAGAFRLGTWSLMRELGGQ